MIVYCMQKIENNYYYYPHYYPHYYRHYYPHYYSRYYPHYCYIGSARIISWAEVAASHGPSVPKKGRSVWTL